MQILPAIDLYKGQIVRLIRGNYTQMTVYGNNPVHAAKDFVELGAKSIHIVDLEGAKDSDTPNFDSIVQIKKETGLFCEVGGGIRNKETVKKYIDAEIDRVILGTAAIENFDFLKSMVDEYKEKIAVSVDILDNYIMTHGWLKASNYDVFAFFDRLEEFGVKTVICTDIAKDGLLKGANRELYKTLNNQYSINIIASGGISNIEDVRFLAKEGIYGAVIGKAYYEGKIDLAECIKEAGA